jgi:hypothetical protein
MSKKQKSNRESNSTWKRSVIVLCCIALIVARYIYPSVQIDTTTVWLVAIAAIAFLFPEIKSFTPYIKRVKIGDTEVELKDEIEKLGNEVEKAQESASQRLTITPMGPDLLDRSSFEIESVLENALKDPRATLLLLSAKIEKELKNRLSETGINTERVYSFRELSRLAVEKEILSKESASALDDFGKVRNRVAHGEAFDVEDYVIYSLISLGTKLLQIISVPSQINVPKEQK